MQLNLIIPSEPFVYVCSNLHRILHGDASNQQNIRADSDSVCIDESNTMSIVDPLSVYFSKADIVQGLRRYIPNLQRFHFNLFQYLFVKYNKTNKKDARDSHSYRLDFGMNQIQPNFKTYRHEGIDHKLTHCNLKSLNDFDHALRRDLFKVLQYFDLTLNKSDNRKCCDRLRREIVHHIYKHSGLERFDFDWEYVNISLRSSKDTLNQHTDSKNDSRSGYNHAAVYSYLMSAGGVIFRVVIIMTFRCNVGSMMDRMHYLKSYIHGIIDALTNDEERSGLTKRELRNLVRYNLRVEDEWKESVFGKTIDTLVVQRFLVKNKRRFRLVKGSQDGMTAWMMKVRRERLVC